MMNLKVRRRKTILYSLIVSVLLIQVIIVIFFYNEFVSKKKINHVEIQLRQSNLTSDLINNSRNAFFTAQSSLKDYFATSDNDHLRDYFSSLNEIAANLSQFDRFGNSNPEFKKYLNASLSTDHNLKKLRILIDSTQQVYAGKKNDDSPIVFEKLHIKADLGKFDIDVQKKTDSLPKKGLFGRLSDAIANHQTTRTDSVIISRNQQAGGINSDEIDKEFQRIIDQANAQYFQRLKEVQQKQIHTRKNYLVENGLFDKLLSSSNALLEMYDTTVNRYRENLQKQYKNEIKQRNDAISRTVLGLMILIFIVSIIIIYYIRQSFEYEKKLQLANKMIQDNLHFKNRIIGMISHEMRAPMQIISLFINRISKLSQNEKVNNYLKTIRYTNESLLTQANQILDYSKNSEEGMKLENQTFHLYEQVEETLRSFIAFIESRGNKLEVENKIPQNLVVFSDYPKIYRLLANLLNNANKFTEHGNIRFLAETTSTLDHEIELAVSISDDGIGIPEEEIDEIFKPFYQGALSDKVENIGAGLGLNLCKEIVELFGGEIHASRNNDKGTTISFKINLQKSHENGLQ